MKQLKAMWTDDPEFKVPFTILVLNLTLLFSLRSDTTPTSSTDSPLRAATTSQTISTTPSSYMVLTSKKGTHHHTPYPKTGLVQERTLESGRQYLSGAKSGKTW